MSFQSHFQTHLVLSVPPTSTNTFLLTTQTNDKRAVLAVALNFKTVVVMTFIALFTLLTINVPVATALPGQTGLTVLELPHSLAARKVTGEAGCPAGQSPLQAGW